MDITIKDKNGATLHTAEKYCEEDINVKLETQEITIMPSKQEQIQEGLINKVTVLGDSNLDAEKIKMGVRIFNVIGSYTSDATAVADDIKKGKTAYIQGTKVTGTYEPVSDEGESSLLPPAYQQLAYIESTGTQYIDTGFLPTYGDSSVVITFKPTKAVTSKEQWVFGQWYGSNGWRCGGSGSSYGYINYETSRGFYFANSSSNLNKNIGMSPKSNITSEYPMLLFAQQEGGRAGYVENSFFRVYECKIWNIQNLVRDFIPCYRKEDGEIGMFDVVGGAFYTNQGTGTFVAGPEV